MSKAVIFDFDGTLVDSEKTINHCFESITRSIAPERINYARNVLIGPPLRETASKILGAEYKNRLDEFVNQFIEMHDENVIMQTQPYPHVTETLKKLYEEKILMIIATNKREIPTIKLINYYNWQNYFISIECSDSHKSIRNKHEMIQDIIKKNHIFKKSSFVGDTINDGLSANRNQLQFLRANYGYGSNQDWSDVKVNRLIENFIELESILI